MASYFSAPAASPQWGLPNAPDAGSVNQITKQLIAARDHRLKQAELKRAEERQARLDEEARQANFLEEGRAAETHELNKMFNEQRIADQKIKAEEAKFAREQEKFQRDQAREDESARDTYEKYQAEAAAEFEKLASTAEGTGPPMPRKLLNKLHPGHFDEQGNPIPFEFSSGGAVAAGGRTSLAEQLTGAGTIGGTEIPFMSLEEELERKAQEAHVTPQVMSALLRAQSVGRGQPASKTVKGVGLVERQDDGQWVVAVPERAPAEGKKLRDLSSKDARELANMRTMAARAADLGSLVSGAEYNLAKWTPESVESFVAQFVVGEGGRDIKPGFYERALTVEPQYFLFAAEMLKAMQGSRPSDRDMEWYIENLPKVTDIPSVKRSKIKDMVNRLSNKYNNEVAALKSARFDMSGFPVMDPDSILEGLEAVNLDGGTKEETLEDIKARVLSGARK